MNLEKVIFGFFVIFACTLNFGFFIGDIDNVKVHDGEHLFAAVVVNLIALVMKFGDRTHIARRIWRPAWWPCCNCWRRPLSGCGMSISAICR